MTTVIGVDPGKTGAYSVWVSESNKVCCLKHIVDFTESNTIPEHLKDLLYLENTQEAPNFKMYIEHVHAAPKQGSSATFKFGENFGWWKGVCDTIDVPYILVTPQKWQTKLYNYVGLKTKPTDTKATSLQITRDLCKNSPLYLQFFSRKKDHNRADAYLIGLYGVLDT